MFVAKPGFVGTVRLKAPKVIDRGRQARAVEQVARGVPVSAGAAVFQREIDHRTQHYRRREWVLAGERIRSVRQDPVVPRK